jgi:hypothetical protein
VLNLTIFIFNCIFIRIFSEITKLNIMKKAILVFGLLSCGLAFGQSNQSDGPVSVLGITPAPVDLLNEVYRFKRGAVTQLQTGLDFDFTERWFTLGQVDLNPVNFPFAPTFYGSLFQVNERAFVQGYAGFTPQGGALTFSNNPRIQWIHNGGSTEGDLEFRVASSFTNGQSDLVATMTSGANTYFATSIPTSLQSLNPKVGIIFEDIVGLSINKASNLPNGSTRIGALIEVNSVERASGLIANSSGGEISTGVFGQASSSEVTYGVFGATSGANSFGAAVYGQTQNQNAQATNIWAGYFNGTVFSTQMYQGSDRKLKNNIENEANVLERLSLLRPVTYTHNDVEGISLPTGNQHGFIAQEMAEVFPELTRDIKQPILDDEGKVDSYLDFKAVNYVGLISVLTAGIQELNTELIDIREELAEYKANDKIRQSLVQDDREVSDYSMEQNIPNPFNDRSIIRYQLAPEVNQASITIFDLNGGFVKDYPINENKGEITILASEIGKGMFIYSLTRNGQEIMSKRMIVR